MPKIKPKIIPKSRIGKNKFEKVLKEANKTESSFYKHPGEKIVNVTKDKNRTYKPVNFERYEKLFNEINTKKLKLKEKGTFFHTAVFNPEAKKIISSGTAIPNLNTFIDSIFNYPKTKHGYEVIGVVNPKGKVLGYTTIKINPVFMKNIQKKIDEYMVKEKVSLREAKNQFTRIFTHMLFDKEKITKRRDNYKIDFYKLLEKYKFEVYFTPESGYTLDKQLNYVPVKK